MSTDPDPEFLDCTAVECIDLRTYMFMQRWCGNADNFSSSRRENIA